MASWKPHGLIQKRILEAPYRDAKLSIDANGNSKDPKEHCTVKLWEDLFNKQLFSGDNFTVNSQQPPSTKKGIDKACDIVVMYVDTNYEHQILCFAECKRPKNVITSKIRALETQAQGYSEDFLEANPDINIAYVCTLVGVYVRCWSLHRGDKKLKGFWSGDEKDHFEHYKDAGSDEHRQLIEWAFDQMKSVPPSGLRLGQDHSTLGGQIGAVSNSVLAYSPANYPSQPVSYTVSYATTSGAPTGQYMHSFPAAQTKSGGLGGDIEGPTRKEYGDEEEDEDEEEAEDEDNEEDIEIGGDANTRQSAPSRAASEYLIVRVTKKAHTIGTDEFIFKDTKGKARSTKRSQWKQIRYNGQLAWKHHHYICLENVFK